ncbi:MAG: DUF3786 domain-containing protein [Proteobacteria bacterium]|nr:DUF3786 domain-containing protein [Pseudomonadota bacterium]
MTTYVDNNYFNDLAKANPSDICRNDRCSYDPTSKSYALQIWGDTYIIDWTQGRIERSDATMPPPHSFFYLFIMYYLLLPLDIKPQGEWISEKDLPGGATFFRGPHLLPTNLISDRFGNDLQGFSDCCRRLGGSPLELADAAFSFTIAKEITIAILYFTGDEDFPAEAKILYDKSISAPLPIDIVFALAVEVCSRIGAVD